MLPDKAVMFLASIEDEEFKANKIHYWRNVYGVDMSCIEDWVMKEPLVDKVFFKAINSDACPILTLDLEKCTVKDLEFSNKY